MRHTLRPTDWTPPAKRVIIVVGGFPKDTPKEHIIRQLRDMILPDAARGWRGEGVSDCFAPNFSSFGRIKFENSEFMWQFLKAFKGHRFMFNDKILFHSIDKTPAEMDLSRKVSRSLKRLRVCLVEGGLLRDPGSSPGRIQQTRGGRLGLWNYQIQANGWLHSSLIRVGPWVWLAQGGRRCHHQWSELAAG